MKIKKFKQIFESFNDSHFTISDEDIQDICAEMTDDGFKLNIEKKYINRVRDSVSNEPLDKKASPLYEITLSNEREEKENPEYWSGGIYFQETKILNMINSVSNRFEKMFTDIKVLWNIRSHEFIVRLILPEIETEIGFDSYHFSQSVNRWSESFENPECLTNVGFSDTKILEFRMKYSKQQLDDLLEKSPKLKIDNKADFDVVLRSFDKTFGNQARNVKSKSISSLPDRPVEWIYEFEEHRRYQYQPKKKGYFSKKPENKEFIWYDLVIKYEVKKS